MSSSDDTSPGWATSACENFRPARVIVVDCKTKQAIGGTPDEQVLASIEHFSREMHEELEAAFQRARKE